MKNIAHCFEEAFMEMAFAEEREIRQRKNLAGSFTARLDDIFTAVTFAEAGEFDTARSSMGSSSTGSSGHIGYCVTGFCEGRA